MIKKRLTKSHLTAEKVSEILYDLKAITVKSPMSVVYRSESEDSDRILAEMDIKHSEKILAGALPKPGQNAS